MSVLLQVQNGKKVTTSMTASGLVCVFHGYGANGQNLYDVVLEMSIELPHLRFILPNGIQHFEGLGFGYQWFSLRDFTQSAMQSGLENVMPKISAWLKLRLKDLQLTEDDLSLIGFSQGAMVSLYAAAADFLKPQKIISFSGMFIPPRKISSQEKHTRILATHGTNDQVLPIEMARESYQLLQRYSLLEFDFTSENSVEHTISQNAMQRAIKFLKL